MTTHREPILETFLDTVDGISDKKYQERVWIRAEGPEWDDLGETYNYFFDNGEPIIDEYKKHKLTEVQYKLVVELRDKLNEFTVNCELVKPYRSDEELINLPEWQEIRDLAKKVCKSFNYKQKPFIG